MASMHASDRVPHPTLRREDSTARFLQNFLGSSRLTEVAPKARPIFRGWPQLKVAIQGSRRHDPSRAIRVIAQGEIYNILYYNHLFDFAMWK